VLLVRAATRRRLKRRRVFAGDEVEESVYSCLEEEKVVAVLGQRETASTRSLKEEVSEKRGAARRR
jgi:hypothetical protein